MARNATLESILTDLRLEAKLATNAALNVQDRDRQIHLIQREQQRLWEEADWPHLRVERFLQLAAGQRFYDPATTTNEAGVAKGDLALDRIEKIEVKDGGDWIPLRPEIGAGHYAAYDSALDERCDPARAWRIYEDEQIEIWPIPQTSAGSNQEGYLRITGIRNLRTLVDGDDRSDLDGRLIALYAASHVLAAKNAPETQLVLEAAGKLFARLTADLKKNPRFQMFGVGREPRVTRPYIHKYVAPE